MNISIQTCSVFIDPSNRNLKARLDNTDIIHQHALVNRLAFEDSLKQIDKVKNIHITEQQTMKGMKDIREHQYKNSHKTIRMRELENLESPPGFEHMKKNLIREQLKIDFIFFPAPPGFLKPDNNYLKRIDESDDLDI